MQEPATVRFMLVLWLPDYVALDPIARFPLTAACPPTVISVATH